MLIHPNKAFSLSPTSLDLCKCMSVVAMEQMPGGHTTVNCGQFGSLSKILFEGGKDVLNDTKKYWKHAMQCNAICFCHLSFVLRYFLFNNLWLKNVQSEVTLYHILDFVAHYISFELDYKLL